MTHLDPTDEIPESSPAQALREAVLDDLLEVSGAAAASTYTLVTEAPDHVLRFARACIRGLPPAHDLWRAFEGRPVSELVSAEEMTAALPQMDRWDHQTAADLPAGMRRLVWDPVGITSAVGVNLTDGTRLIAWVGALFTETDPAPDLISRLTPRLDGYRELLLAAEDAEATPPEDHAVLVVGADGAITRGSTGAGDWWDSTAFRESLLRDIDTLSEQDGPAWLHGAFVRVHPVEGPRGRGHVAIVRRPAPFTIQPVLTLSHRQREIAVLAARGATMKEIGDMLEIQPGTVHTHLKRIYQALGIGSRAELSLMVHEASW